jgi:hypothetical protein
MGFGPTADESRGGAANGGTLGHHHNFSSGPIQPVIPDARTVTSPSQSQGRKTPRAIYAVAPMPAGLVYPDPPSRNTRKTSTDVKTTHKDVRDSTRPASSNVHVSVEVTASGRRSPISSASVRIATDDKPPIMRRVSSNSSIGTSKSYAKYDSSKYLDPAYFAHRDGTPVEAGSAGSAGTSRR